MRDDTTCRYKSNEESSNSLGRFDAINFSSSELRGSPWSRPAQFRNEIKRSNRLKTTQMRDNTLCRCESTKMCLIYLENLSQLIFCVRTARYSLVESFALIYFTFIYGLYTNFIIYSLDCK